MQIRSSCEKLPDCYFRFPLDYPGDDLSLGRGRELRRCFTAGGRVVFKKRGERVTRLELATSSLARRCSTTELHPQFAGPAVLYAKAGSGGNNVRHVPRCKAFVVIAQLGSSYRFFLNPNPLEPASHYKEYL